MKSAADRSEADEPIPESVGSITNVAPKVLLVDDHPSLLLALGETLARKAPELEVERCASARLALERVAAVDYDVVVSDVLMPEMNGLSLLERVRSLRPESPVILITGVGDHELTLKALRGGAYDFIVKPVDPVYFTMSVRRAAETRQLRRAVELQQTELREHAEKLEKIVEERTAALREANRLKDEFLATVSHELRTPLTPVLGWARLLRTGRLDDESRAQALESIERNARAQAQLIDDLLDVSRIVTGKLRLDPQPTDLKTVLASAIEVVAPAATSKGISIERSGAEIDALPTIAGDPERLRQVFWNLLQNAVKFTPMGGKVTIGAAVSARSIEVTISDTGCGISDELMPFIFERFKQGHDVPGARVGLGLGLAIVRHLVELHGGTVNAESREDSGGARFTVSLPLGPRDAQPRRRRPRSDSQGEMAVLGGVHALVLDDMPDTRRVLSATLKGAGARVTECGDAAETFAAIARDPPDVLLCDIGLGQTYADGYDLMRAIRSLPPDGGGTIPSIALTAYAKPEDRAQALAAGFQLHVAKPGPPNLASIVADLLSPKSE